jgi:3,4-dihydroxy 2-butanone 4-phosphate synthase/GTP cyclohydrolase II
MQINTTVELIEDLRQGKMIILMDDEERENEGDLVMVAEQVRPEDINFMAKHARGLVCLTLTREHCEKLALPLMVQSNGTAYETNFTMSIEAAEGVTTGISAADRAHTIRTAVAADVEPNDIVQPGHIFPLMAREGGVMTRAGHTEAGCDLARLAGFSPAAAIVEIMNDDGTMARRDDLIAFAKEHDLKIGTIADLIHFRSLNEKTVNKIDQICIFIAIRSLAIPIWLCQWVQLTQNSPPWCACMCPMCCVICSVRKVIRQNGPLKLL